MKDRLDLQGNNSSFTPLRVGLSRPHTCDDASCLHNELCLHVGHCDDRSRRHLCGYLDGSSRRDHHGVSRERLHRPIHDGGGEKSK